MGITAAMIEHQDKKTKRFTKNMFGVKTFTYNNTQYQSLDPLKSNRANRRQVPYAVFPTFAVFLYYSLYFVIICGTYNITVFLAGSHYTFFFAELVQNIYYLDWTPSFLKSPPPLDR